LYSLYQCPIERECQTTIKIHTWSIFKAHHLNYLVLLFIDRRRQKKSRWSIHVSSNTRYICVTYMYQYTPDRLYFTTNSKPLYPFCMKLIFFKTNCDENVIRYRCSPRPRGRRDNGEYNTILILYFRSRTHKSYIL
jgi:hypothetical protein